MKIHWKSIDFDLYCLSRVTGHWWLGQEREEPERWRERAQGRRRRPGTRQHVQRVASVVPNDLRGVWRPQNPLTLF